jgi:hypothetical protein
MAIYLVEPALTVLVFLSRRHYDWPGRWAPLVDKEPGPGAIVSAGALVPLVRTDELTLQLEWSVAYPVVAWKFMRCQKYVHLIVQ